MAFRSDLIDEEASLCGDNCRGYTKTNPHGDKKITRITVENEEGEKALSRKIGNYSTFDIDDFSVSEEKTEETVGKLAKEIREVTGIGKKEKILAVGLGNGSVIADSLGPSVIKKLIVTRHLLPTVPELVKNMREVSAIIPGVMGQTGMESLEIIKSVVSVIKPDALFLIDSLAAKKPSRLLHTVQVSNRGLVPGGGVGNARAEISEETVGVKCFSVGVPTVVSASDLAEALISNCIASKKLDISAEEIMKNGLSPFEATMTVTPKDICVMMEECSKIVALSLNSVLHPSLSFTETVDWMKA